MIISPPFLPEAGLAAPSGTSPDPMMDAVDNFECAHGIYPIAFDRRWHCGVHLQPDTKGTVHAIADGEVVAYRVCQHAIDDGASHTGFVLLKHTTETGDGRTLTFYSLYMHLLPLAEYQQHNANASEMPEFLRMPTGDPTAQVPPAVKGNENLNVRRKDVLGWLGQYEGMPHLHFEIFMVQTDFDAYFGHTQLGNATPTPSDGADWWGHAYFVIPAGSNFRRLPDEVGADNKLHGIEFTPAQAGSNSLPLLVETYFSQGSKYTNVWSIAQDGTRTLLTQTPVEEKDYEYDLYKRAKALYSTCPSDGYELMRFGRILATPQTLAADARVTWMQVTWAAGQVGYIDINDSNIQKFSDADFLSFAGWQKISDENTPFESDGLCDLDALKKLLQDATDHETSEEQSQTTEAAKADALSRYVKGDEQVRQQLRGLICNAPTEWDSTDNDTRYTKLLDEGGFYHGNRPGYDDFLNYLKEVQFWDKTGLPTGEKLWFFHPLAFIRHFRKCGWMNLPELAQIVPAARGRTLKSVSNLFVSELRDRHDSSRIMRPAHLHVPLLQCMRKYGILTPLRIAHWFGQVLRETGTFQYMRELGDDAYLTNYYEGRCHSPIHRLIHGHMTTLSALGNCNPGDGVRYSGKGMIQLTGGDNYRAYQAYRGGANFTVDPGPQLLIEDATPACDAGGYYWASKQRMQKNPITHKLVPLGKLGINFWSDKTWISTFVDNSQIDPAIDEVSRCVNSALDGRDDRRMYFKHAYSYLSDINQNFPHEFKPLRG